MALTPSARRGAAPARALLATATVAQLCVDVGKRDCGMNRAIWHGSDRQDDGSFVGLPRDSPPAISTMALRNGGAFPLATVHTVIDRAGDGHHPRAMSNWVTAFRFDAVEHHGDAP